MVQGQRSDTFVAALLLPHEMSRGNLFRFGTTSVQPLKLVWVGDEEPQGGDSRCFTVFSHIFVYESGYTVKIVTGERTQMFVSSILTAAGYLHHSNTVMTICGCWQQSFRHCFLLLDFYLSSCGAVSSRVFVICCTASESCLFVHVPVRWQACWTTGTYCPD